MGNLGKLRSGERHKVYMFESNDLAPWNKLSKNIRMARKSRGSKYPFRQSQMGSTRHGLAQIDLVGRCRRVPSPLATAALTMTPSLHGKRKELRPGEVGLREA